MLPFSDIKMHGNGQARNDVGITTSLCRPNLDDFVVHRQHVGEMSATCATKDNLGIQHVNTGAIQKWMNLLDHMLDACKGNGHCIMI